MSPCPPYSWESELTNKNVSDDQAQQGVSIDLCLVRQWNSGSELSSGSKTRGPKSWFQKSSILKGVPLLKIINLERGTLFENLRLWVQQSSISKGVSKNWRFGAKKSSILKGGRTPFKTLQFWVEQSFISKGVPLLRICNFWSKNPPFRKGYPLLKIGYFGSKNHQS